MRNSIQILGSLVMLVLVASCQDKDYRNYQYMPNMYEEVSYETYGNYDVFPNGMEAMQPAEGSVSRGWMPYGYENTPEGYEAAKANLKNPVPYTEDNLNKGKALYTIYCAICHGDKGDGKGTLAKREKVLGVPAYNDQGRAITEGSIYHVTYYGLNTMGSYASQTTEEELWLINHYVIDLKDALDGKPKRAFENEESSQTAAADEPVEEHQMTEEAQTEE
ncbi:quinol:cytochrome c oxidoreductase monoheme cytochrome subunit [Leeuwenhoekiella aestuarii]|uniref:Quinol:cytochrome c oxidoreductase monoheme cytochrome subunit n=1 Tax=Leeuwenhoekiella aestuarii TaxID=2249426 RepID=A0A4Q0NSL4_9FLAO|nr:cytochrome c [Leeuwenhoekiella aestuarii]RXG14125.1 quinol:cytochrome c oxidoreductase monoheme cytochrome subunit [Leeuwenhoekiella aestuarii]RXG18874.1 quinol:cytochrome c oxidoreductase monoheme cytochrome subunit [Leeuwenhoekiella aestuarii]